MKKDKIIFAGYYGAKNTGDDMFGVIASWGAVHYWNNSNIALLSHIGSSSDSISINFALSKTKYFRGYHTLQSFYKIFKTKYIVLAGGSILHSRHKRISPRSFMFYLSKLKIIKIGAIGVSLGPFSSEKEYKYINDVLKEFKFLVVRDRTSYEIALRMNLPYKPVLGADLAFLLPQIMKNIEFKKSPKTTKKLLGISLCHYERYASKSLENEQRRENKIFKVLNKLKNNQDIKFRFFIINNNTGSGDEKLTNYMIKSLQLTQNRYEIISYNTDTLQTVNYIGECDAMFSVRLHGAIFAASQNIPSLLVEYHNKCTDYLDDIGVSKEWRIGDMESIVEEVVSKIHLLLNMKSNNFYVKRNNLLLAVKKNFLDKRVLEEIIEI